MSRKVYIISKVRINKLKRKSNILYRRIEDGKY
jgi:hypothetical protein